MKIENLKIKTIGFLVTSILLLIIMVVSYDAQSLNRELDGLNKPIGEERLIGIIKQATSNGQLPQVLHVEEDDVSQNTADRVSGVLVKSKMDNAHLSETLHQLIAGNFE